MEEIMSPKGQLLLLLSNQQGEFLPNDTKFKIIENYEELMKIIQEINEEPNENIFKFIYSYRTLIHEYILYNEDKTIKIDNFKLKNEFAEYYYLSELIMDNEEIVNYEYNFEFIKKYYELLKLIKFKNGFRIQKIVNYKIFFELINNFCGMDDYDEEINGVDIENFKIEIDEILRENIDVFKELNLENIYINEDSIKSTNLQTIYCDILNSLIKQNKFEDYNYIYSLCCNEMDLNNIRIGKAILPSLQQTLNKNNEYMKSYIIQSKEDLYIEIRINFYYILLKYVLKEQTLIYHIDFLMESRNIILNMIKLHKISYNNLTKETLERLKYILETFAGSKHYFEDNEEIKKEILKLKEILSYYQFYFFETKKEDIEKIKEQIKKQNVKSEYLKDYEKAVEENNKYPIIKYLYYTSCDKEIKSEKEFEKDCSNFKTIYNSIKGKKFQRLKKKDLLYRLLLDENKKEIMFNVFTKEEIDSFINHMKEKEKNDKKIEKKAEKTEKIEKSEKIEKIEKTEEPEKNENIDILKLNKKDIEGTLDDAPKPIDAFQNKIYLINGNDSKIKEKIPSMSTKISSKNNSITPNEEELYDKILQSEDDNQMKNDYSDLADLILKKCQINLSVSKNGGNNNIKIINIFMGDKLSLKATIKKFDNYIKYSEKYVNINDELGENSYKFAKFIKEFQRRIINEYNNNYFLNLEILFTKTDKRNTDSIYNLEVEYTFYEPLKNKKMIYKEDNVLIYGTDSNLQGFNFMIMDINQERYRTIPYKEFDIFNNNFKEKSEKKKSKENLNSVNSSFSELPDIYKKASDINILEIIKIVENKNTYNGFTKELNNGYFTYIKNDNTVVLIDNKYSPVLEVKDYRDKIVNICDMLPSSNNKDKNKINEENIIQIVLCGNRDLYLTTIDLQKMEQNTKQLDISHIYGFSSIEMKKNNYLVTGKNYTSYYTDLFLSKAPKEIRIIQNISYFNSIKINENVAALISNSLLPNGQDMLNFCNIKKKKVLANAVTGYSFNMSQKGLELMPKLDTSKNNRILLCACKKYTKDQQNGILLVNPQLGDNQNVENPFYNTGNVEIYCFCPILIKKEKKEKKEKTEIITKNDNDYDEFYERREKNGSDGGSEIINEVNNFNDKNNNETPELIFEDTNYFLGGGFDEDKREGIIQLYKTIYGEKAYNTRIEYIQDIYFKKQKDIEGFNGPINCLTQSKKTGNILASCYNGNIYLLTPPNINYYLEEDNLEL